MNGLGPISRHRDQLGDDCAAQPMLAVMTSFVALRWPPLLPPSGCRALRRSFSHCLT